MNKFIYFNYNGKKTKATLTLKDVDGIDLYRMAFVDENNHECEGRVTHITNKRLRNYGKTFFMVRYYGGKTIDYEIMSPIKEAQQLEKFYCNENKRFLDEWYFSRNNAKPAISF